MANKKLYFFLVFGFSLIVLFAPVAPGPKGGWGWDKIVHLVLFASLFWTFHRGYPKFSLNWGFIIFLIYALMSEMIQGQFLPTRNFDWFDVLADVSGLLCIIILFFYAEDRKKV